MLQIQAIAIKLGNRARCDNNTGCVVTKLEQVKSREQRLAHGCGEAVVGRRGEREQIDGGLRLGADDAATRVGAEGGDGDGEELFARAGGSRGGGGGGGGHCGRRFLRSAFWRLVAVSELRRK